MEPLSREDRKSIFKKELYALKNEDYISEKTYELVFDAHQRFHMDLAEKEKRAIEKAQMPIPEVKVVEKPAVVKKVLTPEEIRERNISWLLNLGVILLLIGGLFVATSNWENMTSWMKSSSIACVSLLFYGIAYIANKYLRIEKTAFAFTVLGSLFLPIFFLSVGWFELLGPYLSISGEGRHLFGAISSLLLLPVYIPLAKKLSSRLFVWFAYLALTIGVGFFIVALHIEKDGFYLAIMLYNALLFYAHHKYKNRENMKLFTKELVYFAQINLVLSTLLMLTFFESHVFYGLNIILTAVIYLAMVYVTGKKEFHFVFSTMIVYGVYQLIEYSILEAFGPALYALVAIGFLALPKAMADNMAWDKIFRLTSAVISGAAFLYITLENFLLNAGEPSFVLLAAYIVISCNFIYLANTFKNLVFAYLSPIFISAALYEVVQLLDEVLHFEELTLPVFAIGFILLLLFGCLGKHRFIKVIQNGSRDIGFSYMFLAILVAISTFSWWETGLMLLLFTLSGALVLRLDKRFFYKDSLPWIIPASFGLAFAAFSQEWRSQMALYESTFGIPTSYVIGSIMLLAGSFFVKNNLLKRNAFFISQGMYTIAILLSFVLPINDVFVRPLILLGGVAMYTALYKFTKFKWVTYLIASVTLVFYFTVLDAIHTGFITIRELDYVQLTFGAVILLTIAFLLKNKEEGLYNGFSWVGHVYLPLSLLATFFIYQEYALTSFILAVSLYALSVKQVQTEWRIKTYLYAFFTSVFMVVLCVLSMHYYHYQNYAFIITSALIAVFWQLANPLFKKRSSYYLILFSLLGMVATLTIYPFNAIPYGLTVVYAIGVLYFLHVNKLDYGAIVPLFLIFAGTIQYLLYNQLNPLYEVLILTGLGLGMLVSGHKMYKKLFEKGEPFGFSYFDSYTFIALLNFAAIYAFGSGELYDKLLPGLLISLTFCLQRNRIPGEWKWIPTFMAGAYLLEPYYSLLNEFDIHYLFIREMQVLPFIVLIIFLRWCTKGRYALVTSRIQWAVLIIVSLLLIQDALQTSTIYDALLIGSLSLISILAGLFYRIKSYFFVGSGVLLLNVILQTRPFWGNMPWWAYLLIAGTILISVASYNEWHKQKTAKGEATLLSKVKKKVIDILKRWN